MISGIIIAGGKSTRMGVDKKFIEINGCTFLQHVIGAAKKVADGVIIVVGSKEQAERTKKVTDLMVVIDELPEMGPLMGILTGLKKCTSEYAFIMPVDTPLMNPEIYNYMISESKDMDAVIPKDREYLEPMHALYRVRPMISACEKSLNNGNYSIRTAINHLQKVKFIPLKDFKKFDTDLRSFRSVNTKKELKALEDLLKERSKDGC